MKTEGAQVIIIHTTTATSLVRFKDRFRSLQSWLAPSKSKYKDERVFQGGVARNACEILVE